MKIKSKRIILIDLDGVLNNYKGNFKQDYIEPVTDSAYKFIKELSEYYRLILFTSRDIALASKWVNDNNLSEYIEEVTNTKKPCFLLIDDRCITFNGNFSELKNKICNFEVWYKK